MTQPPTILVVMGVTGVGKSTLAERSSRQLGWTFMEGDKPHPETNVTRMRAGLRHRTPIELHGSAPSRNG